MGRPAVWPPRPQATQTRPRIPRKERVPRAARCRRLSWSLRVNRVEGSQNPNPSNQDKLIALRFPHPFLDENLRRPSNRTPMPTYLVVVGHVEDDGQLALVRAVVHKHHAPDLHKPSEPLRDAKVNGARAREREGRPRSIQAAAAGCSRKPRERDGTSERTAKTGEIGGLFYRPKGVWWRHASTFCRGHSSNTATNEHTARGGRTAVSPPPTPGAAAAGVGIRVFLFFFLPSSKRMLGRIKHMNLHASAVTEHVVAATALPVVGRVATAPSERPKPRLFAENRKYRSAWGMRRAKKDKN